MQFRYLNLNYSLKKQELIASTFWNGKKRMYSKNTGLLTLEKSAQWGIRSRELTWERLKGEHFFAQFVRNYTNNLWTQINTKQCAKNDCYTIRQHQWLR